jgi:hypothetical protein
MVKMESSSPNLIACVEQDEQKHQHSFGRPSVVHKTSIHLVYVVIDIGLSI